MVAFLIIVFSMGLLIMGAYCFKYAMQDYRAFKKEYDKHDD